MSSENENQDKRLVYQMLHFLEGRKEKASDSEKAQHLETALEHLSKAFDIDMNCSETFKEESLYPTDLAEVFSAGVETLQAKVYKEKLEKASQVASFPAFVDTVAKKGYFADSDEGSVEYLKRHAKVVTKFQNKIDASKASKEADNSQLADQKKAEGNALLSKKKFHDAISCYSEAIALSPSGPSSHIYYCNRAAARCHIQDYKNAISDCKQSISLNKSYAKAFSRLGLAHYFLKEYDASIDAYEEGLVLEPNNQSIKESLQQAKSARDKEDEAKAQSPAAGGMPDLSSLAGMMGGGGGGMPDMSKLMQNPQMMSMAQEMMKNPQMMQQAMNMMQGMGGGGSGGMPDMSALAGMMGNFGGGNGGGSEIPDFSGFRDESQK